MKLSMSLSVILLAGAPLLAQPCDPASSVTLIYCGDSQCITVCEGSETTLKVPMCSGCSECVVEWLSRIDVMSYDPNLQCPGPFDGWATLDRFAWSLTEADTFVNVIHGVQNGQVVVYFECMIYNPPVIQYDPANGFPQSMCVMVEYGPFAHPCFGPFPPGQVPRITEHPGCNPTNNCNWYNYNDPPDTYESSIWAFPNVGIYIWNAIEYGDWGGHLCVTMEGLLNPEPPANLTILADSLCHVLLQWTHPGADSFEVSSAPASGGPFTHLAFTTQSQYTDSVLERMRVYQVSAFSSGFESSPGH